MTNMPGDLMDDDKLVIADADVLISSLLKEDVNHRRILDLRSKLAAENYDVNFTNTAVLEAVTVLRRVFSRDDFAKALISDYLAGKYGIIYVDEPIQKLASEVFFKERPKKNTIFDAVILATAKSLRAAAIFSFDTWYSKQGFRMVEDLF